MSEMMRLKCFTLKDVSQWVFVTGHSCSINVMQCIAAAFLSHQSKQTSATFQLDSDWKLMFRRFFYQFLLANERNVAKEIRDEYVDTMSKIYNSYFKSYSSRLLKVQVSPPRSSTKVNTFLQINRIN